MSERTSPKPSSADYGEPLAATVSLGRVRVWYADGDLCAVVEDNLGLDIEADLMARRIVVCVNALRGIADPEAFVRAADALAGFARHSAACIANAGVPACGCGWADLDRAYRAARRKP